MLTDRVGRTTLAVAAMSVVAAAVLVACGSSKTALTSAPKIKVTAARTPLPASPDVGAVYLTIANESSQPDMLLSAMSDVSPQTMLHRDVTNGATEEMVPAGPITIGAGKTLVLQPGGYHLMLMNLNRHLAVGNIIHVTLDFTRAGAVSVTVPVVSIAAGAPDDTSMSGASMP